MPKQIWNEGRVVGFSAYEIYLKQLLAEDPNATPASEREWLASSLAMGSSLLVTLPKISGTSYGEYNCIDIQLPEGCTLAAANTIVGSFFIGTPASSESSPYSLDFGETWLEGDSGAYYATEVQSYKANVPTKHEDTPPVYTDHGKIADVESSSGIIHELGLTETQRKYLRSYMKIVDGVVLQPGEFEVNPEYPDDKSKRRFVPDLTSNTRGRLRIVMMGDTGDYPPTLLLTGFTIESVLHGLSKTVSNKPENGDFLGPATFPWANKIVFSIPSAYISYFAAGMYDRKHPADTSYIKNSDTPMIDMRSQSGDRDLDAPVLENYYRTSQTTDRMFYFHSTTAYHVQGDESGGIRLASTAVEDQLVYPEDVEIEVGGTVTPISEVLLTHEIPDEDEPDIDCNLSYIPIEESSINANLRYKENGSDTTFTLNHEFDVGTPQSILDPKHADDPRFSVSYNGIDAFEISMFKFPPPEPGPTEKSELMVFNDGTLIDTPLEGSDISFRIIDAGRDTGIVDSHVVTAGDTYTINYAQSESMIADKNVYNYYASYTDAIEVQLRVLDKGVGTDTILTVPLEESTTTLTVMYSNESTQGEEKNLAFVYVSNFSPTLTVGCNYDTGNFPSSGGGYEGQRVVSQDVTIEISLRRESLELATYTVDTRKLVYNTENFPSTGETSARRSEEDDVLIQLDYYIAPEESQNTADDYITEIVQFGVDYDAAGTASATYTLSDSNPVPDSSIVTILKTTLREGGGAGPDIVGNFMSGSYGRDGAVTYDGDRTFTLTEDSSLYEYSIVKLYSVSYHEGQTSASCTLDSTPAVRNIDVRVFNPDGSLYGTYTFKKQEKQDVVYYDGYNTFTVYYSGQNFYIGSLSYYVSSGRNPLISKELSRIDNLVRDYSTLGQGESVLTVYQRLAKFPPALYGTYVDSIGHHYLHPLDVVAPGSVKMFHGDDGTEMSNYQDTFLGTTALNMDNDGYLYSLSNKGTYTSVAGKIQVEPFNTTGLATNTTIGGVARKSISLSTTGGNDLPVTGTAGVQSIKYDGITWGNLLEALAKNRRFNLASMIVADTATFGKVTSTNDGTGRVKVGTTLTAGDGISLVGGVITNTKPYDLTKSWTKLQYGVDYYITSSPTSSNGYFYNGFKLYSPGYRPDGRYEDVFSKVTQKYPPFVLSLYASSDTTTVSGVTLPRTVSIKIKGSSYHIGNGDLVNNFQFKHSADYWKSIPSWICRIVFKNVNKTINGVTFNLSKLNQRNSPYKYLDTSESSIWNVREEHYDRNKKKYAYTVQNLRASWPAIHQLIHLPDPDASSGVKQELPSGLLFVGVSYADGYNQQFSTYEQFKWSNIHGSKYKWSSTGGSTKDCTETSSTIMTGWINLNLSGEFYIKGR